jgi:hypothetical protein
MVGLYSHICDIVSFVLLLVVGFIGLWNGKSLQKATVWRIRLEQAKEHGMEKVRDEWEPHGLSFPISLEKVEAELLKARDHENSLRAWRKGLIVLLMTLGALFFFVAKYFSVLGM